MSEEKVYYEDEKISITYHPTEDDYLIRIESTKGFEKCMSLDQRILEEFSKKDLKYVSETLARMDLSNGLSRTDVIRVYDAILKTMEKYEEEVKEFRASENL